MTSLVSLKKMSLFRGFCLQSVVVEVLDILIQARLEVLSLRVPNENACGEATDGSGLFLL